MDKLVNVHFAMMGTILEQFRIDSIVYEIDKLVDEHSAMMGPF